MKSIDAKERAQIKYEVLDEISSVWNGKQMYFLEPNGVVYSRYACKNLPTVDDAINEFTRIISDDQALYPCVCSICNSSYYNEDDEEWHCRTHNDKIVCEDDSCDDFC